MTDSQRNRDLHPLIGIGISAIVALAVGLGTIWIAFRNTERLANEQARIARLNRQESTARDLLTEALAVLKLQESWILQGPGSREAKISDHPSLGETEQASSLWLRRVEIRAVLDEAEWNS